LWFPRHNKLTHMAKALTAFVLAAAFVGVVMLLGRLQIATPLPFLLLLPGLAAGAAVPGSGFVLKEDNPWSPLAVFVLFAVNITLYSGLIYLLLHTLRKRRSSMAPDN
jgi:hypothetical protein